MLKRISHLVVVLIGVLGCTPLPDVGENRSEALRNATYPEFIPLNELPTQPKVNRVAIEQDVQARLARVNTKAKRLRGPVLTPAERSRLKSRRTIVRGQVLSPADRQRLGTRLQ